MPAHRLDERHQRLANVDDVVARDHAVVDEQRHVEGGRRRLDPQHLAPVAVLLDAEVGRAEPHDRAVASQNGDVRLRLARLEDLGKGRDAGGIGRDDDGRQQCEQERSGAAQPRRPVRGVSPLRCTRWESHGDLLSGRAAAAERLPGAYSVRTTAHWAPASR